MRAQTITRAAVVIAAVVGFATTASAEVKAGDRAAEFTNVKTPTNKRLRLRSYRGKIVVLTFGASWCKPCRKELPAYDKLANKYKKAGVKDVVFIAVNIDTERENADSFLADTNVKHLTVGLDPAGSTVAKYEPDTMPTTYLVDDNGIVRTVHKGFHPGDEHDIEAKVNELRDKLALHKAKIRGPKQTPGKK